MIGRIGGWARMSRHQGHQGPAARGQLGQLVQLTCPERCCRPLQRARRAGGPGSCDPTPRLARLHLRCRRRQVQGPAAAAAAAAAMIYQWPRQPCSSSWVWQVGAQMFSRNFLLVFSNWALRWQWYLPPLSDAVGCQVRSAQRVCWALLGGCWRFGSALVQLKGRPTHKKVAPQPAQIPNAEVQWAGDAVRTARTYVLNLPLAPPYPTPFLNPFSCNTTHAPTLMQQSCLHQVSGGAKRGCSVGAGAAAGKAIQEG